MSDSENEKCNSKKKKQDTKKEKRGLKEKRGSKKDGLKKEKRDPKKDKRHSKNDTSDYNDEKSDSKKDKTESMEMQHKATRKIKKSDSKKEIDDSDEDYGFEKNKSDSKKDKSGSKKEKRDSKKDKRDSKKKNRDSTEKELVGDKAKKKKLRKLERREKLSDIDSSTDETTQAISVDESSSGDEKPGRSKKKEEVLDTESNSHKEPHVVSVDESKTSDEKPRRSKKNGKAPGIESSSDKESEVVSVDESNAGDEEPKEPEKKANASDTDGNGDKATEDALAVNLAKDVSVTDATDGSLDWLPVCHPRLPVITPPRYFVNKRGVLSSRTTSITGELHPMKWSKKGHNISYLLYVDKRKCTTFKLEEIMVYTFSEQPFDRDVHYIFHKDGDQSNCAWDNLVVCDSWSALQELEIARLDEQHPGTKHTVVRNIHDTLTFERYLVSDAGKVYSIARHHYIDQKHGTSYRYPRVTIVSDPSAEQRAGKSFLFTLHSVVMYSFRGRPSGNLVITHINGDDSDNSLQNLEYVTQSECRRRANEADRQAIRKSMKKSGRNTLQPLPPVTSETRWKTIGVLPWNEQSFCRYEVSDMGHVRRIGATTPRALSCSESGYAQLKLCCDKDACLSPGCTGIHTGIVSRLVANAFVDGRSEVEDTVIHLNGDRQDNRAQNLKWVAKNSASISKNACKVVASLVDDPTIQKEFLSLRQLGRELSIPICWRKTKHDKSMLRDVIWDGQQKTALIELR